MPLLPWIPEPLTYERRREALRQFQDLNATQIAGTAAHIRATIARLGTVRDAMTPQARTHFDLGINRLEALTEALFGIAAGMGWSTADHPE